MPHPEVPGPPGGDAEPEPGTRQTRLYRRALEDGWAIDPGLRLKILKKVAQALGRAKKPRDIATLSRALLNAYRQNLDLARLDMERERLEAANPPADTMDDYAIDLSADPDAIPDADAHGAPPDGQSA